jgi:glutamyl-tRNA reductase
MNLIGCISINHRNAPVEIREQIRIEPKDILAIMDKDSEAFTLNTCNRTEVYFRELSASAVYAHLSSLCGITRDALEDVADHFIGREAIRHMFMVACGLDSLVIGEPQVLGQIKDAYRDCLALNTTGTLLNKALHRAFRTAKRIRTETDIGKYSVSVASEAVELASHIFGDITHSAACIIGAGDMASIAAKRLKSRGVKTMSIINRTHSAACDLAEELGGVPKPFENLQEELAICDIVISSTGSATPLITRDMIEAVMKLRKNSPIIIIDIAVPRDVDPEAGKCYNCYLYDIDSLKAIVDRHFKNRQESTQQALDIINHEINNLENWLSSLNANTTIRDLFSLMEDYIEEQLRDIPLDEAEKGIVENSLRTSLKRFIHRPVSFLKTHPHVNHIEQTRRIFQLDEDYQDRHKR